MMKTLLKNERNIFMNTLRTLPTQNIIGFGVVILILLFFLYFISRGVWGIAPLITPDILSALLSYVFIIIIGFGILLGTAQVFKDLYTATDLQLLFTLPIRTRHVFWIKYIKSFINVPLFIVVLFVIPLWIYGISASVNLLYYPIILFVLIATSLIGLSLAFLINLVLVQIIPAHRANEFITVMSFLSGILTYFLIMAPSMRGDGDLLETIVSGLTILPKWVPVTWGAIAVSQAAIGSIKFIIPLLGLVLLTIVLILLSTSLTERGFRQGWVRFNEGPQRKKRRPAKKRTYKVRHPIIAIGKKDWYMIKRDMREWIVLMPIAVFFIFGFIGFFISGDIKLSDLRMYSDISWPIGQVIFLFLFSLTNGTLAASSIGREGPSAWILRILPARGLHIAYGKLWISWLIPLVALSILELGFSLVLFWSIGQIVAGILLKGVITFGSSALGLWIGTIGAKYHPTNPQARTKFFATVLLFISSYIYLLIILMPIAIIFMPPGVVELDGGAEVTGLFSKLMFNFSKLIVLKGEYPSLVIGLAIIAVIFISISITYLFTKLSARNIERGIDIDIVSATRSRRLFTSKDSL